MAVEHAARHLDLQAQGCRRLGSELYADLLSHAATDLRAGGITADVLGGHLDLRGRDALGLRLLAGVHALVLSRQAPDLAVFYPSVGGAADSGPDGTAAWTAMRDVLRRNNEQVRPWLQRAPQTNEVGRGTALLGGLLVLRSRRDLPIRLVEMGASAGLTLRADHFHVSDAPEYGDPASPVDLGPAWCGAPVPASGLQVTHRVAGDLSPVDAASTGGRLLLTAYVWPDQRQRLERLRGALELAARIPVQLHREPAHATVRRWRPVEGSWNVLWQSVFQQYLSADAQHSLEADIAANGAGATSGAPLARIRYEPDPDDPESFVVSLTTWPEGGTEVLGTGPAHGLPVMWHETMSAAR